MTLKDIDERLEYIRNVAGDNEDAHIQQDMLYEAVLRAIAKGVRNPKLLAAKMLEVEDIEFIRWYA